MVLVLQNIKFTLLSTNGPQYYVTVLVYAEACYMGCCMMGLGVHYQVWKVETENGLWIRARTVLLGGTPSWNTRSLHDQHKRSWSTRTGQQNRNLVVILLMCIPTSKTKVTTVTQTSVGNLILLFVNFTLHTLHTTQVSWYGCDHQTKMAH